MKNIFQILLLVFLLTSCEEVIDVDLNTAPPQLIVDAPIYWDKTTDGKLQTITISKTSDYFKNEMPMVSGAKVYITNSKAEVFNFIDNNDGKYVCSDFISEINETYTLTVEYNGTIFKATEKMIPAPSINSIEDIQTNGFAGGKTTEIKIKFNDPKGEKNFYLTGAKPSSKPLFQYGVQNDQFTDGNEMFELYRDDELKSNESVSIVQLGISEGYYNYLKVLLAIAGNSGGGPFSTPSATVKGNIINQTDKNKNPLGYFRASQVNNITYTITSKE
jgi:hypothetical protein